MVEKWRQGYEVVYAQRTQRHREGWFKRFTAYVFYRLLRKLADVDIPTDTGDFCLMDRRVIDILNAMPERNRYLRGLRSWIGFRQTAIPFEREPRFAGEVKYTFRKSFGLAVNGLVSFSKVPLRISTYLGLFAAAIAVLMAILVVYWRVSYPTSPLTGYAVISSAIFFLGRFSCLALAFWVNTLGAFMKKSKIARFTPWKRLQVLRLRGGSRELGAARSFERLGE